MFRSPPLLKLQRAAGLSPLPPEGANGQPRTQGELLEEEGWLAGHGAQLDPRSVSSQQGQRQLLGGSVASEFGRFGHCLKKDGQAGDPPVVSPPTSPLFPSRGISWAEPGKRERRQGPGALSERVSWLPPPHSPSLGCGVRWLPRSWGKPGGSISISLGACRRWSSQAISPILGYNSWGSVTPEPRGPAAAFKAFPCSRGQANSMLLLYPAESFPFASPNCLSPYERSLVPTEQDGSGEPADGKRGGSPQYCPLAPATKGASGRVAPKGSGLPRAHEGPGSIRHCCPKWWRSPR